MGLPENPKKVGNPWVTGWNAYMEPRILIKVSLLKRDMITWQYKDQQGGAQISTGWAVKAWPFLDNETEARLPNLTWSQRKQRHCVYRLVLLAACDFEMQNVLFWLSSFQTVRKQMSGWHCAQGGQWVTHREWVASVCLGDFTLFRQALQECPTIRPTGSCSTDPLGRHWLTGKPAVWQNTAFTIYSLLTVAHNCQPTIWPIRGSDTVTQSNPCPVLAAVKTAWDWWYNGDQSGQGSPGSWETDMTDRWEMLHLTDLGFSAKLLVCGK